MSDATTQVDPHSRANWMIDFVSSSMNPAPRKKNSHDHLRAAPRTTANTDRIETSSTTARAFV